MSPSVFKRKLLKHFFVWNHYYTKQLATIKLCHVSFRDFSLYAGVSIDRRSRTIWNILLDLDNATGFAQQISTS